MTKARQRERKKARAARSRVAPRGDDTVKIDDNMVKIFDVMFQFWLDLPEIQASLAAGQPEGEPGPTTAALWSLFEHGFIKPASDEDHFWPTFPKTEARRKQWSRQHRSLVEYRRRLQAAETADAN
jgi:hypothetical protein